MRIVARDALYPVVERVIHCGISDGVVMAGDAGCLGLDGLVMAVRTGVNEQGEQ